MIESLTREIQSAAEKYIKKIDSLGGALKAIEAGYPHREIQESAYRYQKEVESGDRVFVGVNQFVTPYAKIKSLIRIDPAEEKKQAAALKKVKKERDAGKVSEALDNLRKVARSQENTMPAFIRCVEAEASIGEISDVLREVFGVQREFLII